MRRDPETFWIIGSTAVFLMLGAQYARAHSSPALIGDLRSVVCPTAIGGFVVPKGVNAIHRHPVRTPAHVANEALVSGKIILAEPPLVTNFDTKSAVIPEVHGLRIVAPAEHCAVRPVLWLVPNPTKRCAPGVLHGNPAPA